MKLIIKLNSQLTHYLYKKLKKKLNSPDPQTMSNSQTCEHIRKLYKI
jgi:hypothetical protein